MAVATGATAGMCGVRLATGIAGSGAAVGFASAVPALGQRGVVRDRHDLAAVSAARRVRLPVGRRDHLALVRVQRRPALEGRRGGWSVCGQADEVRARRFCSMPGGMSRLRRRRVTGMIGEGRIRSDPSQADPTGAVGSEVPPPSGGCRDSLTPLTLPSLPSPHHVDRATCPNYLAVARWRSRRRGTDSLDDPPRVPTTLTAEHRRLEEARGEHEVAPLGDLSSANGSGAPSGRTTPPTATHGITSRTRHARSRAYRWGEDGLLGLCDNRGLFNFALALWNGKDPFLKERLFGLSGPEGNHGETVCELYWYVDATPTRLVCACTLQVSAARVSVRALRALGRSRSRAEPSPRILDTDAFDDDRYFDVEVEYAKATPSDMLVRITVTNRGPEPATIDVLPTFWFRNTWTWDDAVGARASRRSPELRAVYGEGEGRRRSRAPRRSTARSSIWLEDAKELLFTDNETNTALLYDTPNRTSYVKDAFHNYVCQGQCALR